MTDQERQVYDAAVEFIEAHGGIVLDPGETPESIIAKTEMALDDVPDTEDLEELKAEAKEKFKQMLGRQNLTYTAVEDMMHDHGLEMDYIEEWIHQM